jgi:hypothetical protein
MVSVPRSDAIPADGRNPLQPNREYYRGLAGEIQRFQAGPMREHTSSGIA